MSNNNVFDTVQCGQPGFKFTKDMLNAIKINTLLVWGDTDQVS